jgi:hypothetical protein
VLSASNYLVNYNNLINKPDLTVITTNNTNLSNYVLSASNYLVNYNNLINKPDLTVIATNNSNVSNYILATSNSLILNANLIDANTTAKITLLCNTLLAIGTVNDNNISNYVFSTSNYLVNYNNLINKPNDFSDERLKTKISDINEPLKIINNLNGFYYIPNELAHIKGIIGRDKEIGLSAQEVQKVLPEIVKIANFDLDIDKDGNKKSKSGENYLTMSYERLAPVFVEAIKELETKNKVQEQKILELERKNQELTDKYNKILEDIIIIKKTVWRL